MGKILLFGTNSIKALPEQVESWITQYNSQGHSFITGDKNSADRAFQTELSRVGAAKNSEIYCMGNPKDNPYKIKVRSFETEYSEEENKAYIVLGDESEPLCVIDNVKSEQEIGIRSEWYEFLDKAKVIDCDMAIFVSTDEISNSALHTIRLLSIYDKPCYKFKV